MRTNRSLLLLAGLAVLCSAGCATIDPTPAINWDIDPTVYGESDIVEFNLPKTVNWRICEAYIKRALEKPDLSLAGYFYSNLRCRDYPWRLEANVDMQMALFVTSGSTTAWDLAGQLADQAGDPLWQEYVRLFRTYDGHYAPEFDASTGVMVVSISDPAIREDIAARIFFRLYDVHPAIAGYVGEKTFHPEYLRLLTRLVAGDLIDAAPSRELGGRLDDAVRPDEATCGALLELAQLSQDPWILETAVAETACPLPSSIPRTRRPWYEDDGNPPSTVSCGGPSCTPGTPPVPYTVDMSGDVLLYTIRN